MSTPQSMRAGDGFEEDDITAVLQASSDRWTPPREYDEVDIGSLSPGPQCVFLVARIVNIYHTSASSRMPQGATGWFKIIVKDDTGAITVRLWHANATYPLRLGHLVTVWTTHVSLGAGGNFAPSSAPLLVSIFPERDRSCHLNIHEDTDEGILCKMPLGYEEGKSLEKLVTLENFMEGAWEVSDVRIMVCVKSIGAKKKQNNRNGVATELVKVWVYDNTTNASLTLWGAAMLSVQQWTPCETVLLITNPLYTAHNQHVSLSLSRESYVDVDPDLPDTKWLREFARRLTKREHVNPLFPDEVIDLYDVLSEPVRVLYNLAEIDKCIREDPSHKFTGFTSIMILGTNIVTLHLRNMLLCTECCGVPVYANRELASCKQCEKEVTLRINPRVVGTIADETGSIAQGKLLWSQNAWEQLLGRGPQELVDSSSDVLRYLEKRLAFLRVTLVFGWWGEDLTGGRLTVLNVMQ